MGLCEKDPGTFGTMYNTQLFLGPGGEVLGKHQKLVPTVGERLVHRPGGPDTFVTAGPPWSNVSNAPFRRHKQSNHEGGIATPLIAHWC